MFGRKILLDKKPPGFAAWEFLWFLVCWSCILIWLRSIFLSRTDWYLCDCVQVLEFSWIPELWTFNLDPWASIFEIRSLNFELLILLMVLELWISNSPYFEIWLLLMDYKGKLWICWFLIFFILLARFSWLWMSSFLILFSWVLDEIYHFSDYMVCFFTYCFLGTM